MNISNGLPNILIVDDEPANIYFLEELLSELTKVNLISANSGYKAIDFCKKKEMAIILLDLMMPDIDGFKVIEKVRETKYNKDTPVIIISGAVFDFERILVESIYKGAIDFIPKPINTFLLLGKVRQFLNIYTQKEELKKLVNKLALSNSKTRDSRIMLHKITSVANDAILVINEKGKISFWNESALALFNYSKKEIRNLDHRLLFSNDRKTQVFTFAMTNYLRNTNEPIIQHGTAEVTVIKKEGQAFPVEISVSSFLYNGKFHIVMIIRNISERIAIQNSMLKAKELKEANKVMREFMDNVSHELRTPMNAIIGISKMILKYNSENLTGKQREGLELITSSGNRLLDLINDILDLSRLEANKEQAIYESFSFLKFLNSIKNTIVGLIDNKDIKFVIKKSQSVPEFILGDFRKLTQILLNILGNSVKFTEKGKIELNIHEAENKLYFEISDTGIGISEEDKKIIFNKFRTIESATTKKHKGTGLGLSITKNLVELLGGQISFQSELGKGTIMSFYVKYLPNQAKIEELEEKKETVAILESAENRGKTIVLIEEDIELCYLLENYLKIQKHKIYSFHDGISGYKAIVEHTPDLVILDIEIPGITGYDLVKKINRNYPGKFPVILVSGIGYVPNKKKYVYKEIIHKPVTENALINVVNKVLGNSGD